MRRILLALAALVGLALHAEFTPPPKPTAWVTDQPGMLNEQTKATITKELKALENKNSCQVIVYITKTHGETPMEEWTHGCARAWGVGQKDLNNGAVLFVFTHDKKIRLEMGTNLEGIFPDLICGDITKPLMSQLDARKPNEGMLTAVRAITTRAAAEYKAPEGWKPKVAGTTTSVDPNWYKIGGVVIGFIVLLFLLNVFGIIDFDILSFIFGFLLGQVLGGSSSSSSGSGFSSGGGDFSGGGSSDD